MGAHKPGSLQDKVSEEAARHILKFVNASCFKIHLETIQYPHTDQSDHFRGTAEVSAAGVFGICSGNFGFRCHDSWNRSTIVIICRHLYYGIRFPVNFLHDRDRYLFISLSENSL